MDVTWPLRTMIQAAADRPAAPAPAEPSEAEWLAALGLAPAAAARDLSERDEEERSAAALVQLHYLAEPPEPPPFPRAALRLLELLLDDDVDVAELARLLELDAALAGAVLARANAAASRALDPIESVRHAVTRLGLPEVARVAAATAFRALYDERSGAAPGAFASLWPLLLRHAVATGRLAAELAGGRAGVGPGLAFAAGLLHDTGLPVALRSLAALTRDGTLAAREPASALRVLERAHLALGEEVASAWGLPPRLVEAVVGHHAPALSARPPLVRVVAAASALDRCAAFPEAAHEAGREAAAAARALGQGPAWLGRAAARRDEAVAWTRRAFSLA